MKASLQPSIRRPARYGLVLLILLGVSLAAADQARLTYGKDQDIRKLNRFVQSTKQDTPSARMFREGRDLVETESWQKAAEKFNAFIVDFPRDKDVDAALYWYAYALQKQGKKAEALPMLKRLIQEYPRSSWRREAETMLVVLDPNALTAVKLDRENCEIKILALQSLFQADEDRAMAFVADVLKSTSTDCPELKSAAVSLLGSHGGARAVPLLLDIARGQGDLKLRLTAIRRLGDQNSDAIAEELARIYAAADQTKEVRVQILRAFGQMHTPLAETKLTAIARGGDDVSLRQLAIRYLENHNNASSLDALISLYDTDKTPAIRSQILRSLSEREDPKAQAKLLEVARSGETPELRIEAIRQLGNHGGMPLDNLMQLYSTETDAAIKQGLIRAYSDMKDPRAQSLLYDIARGNDTPELHGYAIRRLGEKDDPQTVEKLLGLYDAEKNADVRGALLRAFGHSHQKVALQKLMAVARNDQSVELRKFAVRMLGESKDPEALKFLEDLLK